LHTAFIEDNFERVRLSADLHIDLIFYDQQRYQANQQMNLQSKSKNETSNGPYMTRDKSMTLSSNFDDGNSSDSAPEQCPRDCEREQRKQKLQA